MRVRKFMMPFWVMLSMGGLSAGFSLVLLHELFQLPVRGYSLRGWRILSFFFLPAIMWVEAVMYWIVRNRMVNRRDARRHVLFFLLAFLVPYFKALLFFFSSYFLSFNNFSTFTSRVNLVHICLFWLLTIYAHFFFVRVLMRAFARQEEEEERRGETAHMLDDILD